MLDCWCTYFRRLINSSATLGSWNCTLTDSFCIQLVRRDTTMGWRWCGQVMSGHRQGMAGLARVGTVAEERWNTDFVGLKNWELGKHKKLIPPTSPYAPTLSCAILFVYHGLQNYPSSFAQGVPDFLSTLYISTRSTKVYKEKTEKWQPFPFQLKSWCYFDLPFPPVTLPLNNK